MGDGEGKGGKAMATVTRVVGERTATARKAMAAMTRSGGAGGGNDPPLCTTGQ